MTSTRRSIQSAARFLLAVPSLGISVHAASLIQVDRYAQLERAALANPAIAQYPRLKLLVSALIQSDQALMRAPPATPVEALAAQKIRITQLLGCAAQVIGDDERAQVALSDIHEAAISIPEGAYERISAIVQTLSDDQRLSIASALPEPC